MISVYKKANEYCYIEININQLREYLWHSETVRGRDNSLGAGLEHRVNTPPPPSQKTYRKK